MTLYDIAGEYQRLYDLATDIEDPDSEEAFNNALEDLNTDLAVKAEGYATVIRQLEMEGEECDRLVKLLTAKRDVRRNHAKRMKETFIKALDMIGKDTVDAGMFTLKVSKNGGKQPMTVDEGKVPDNYMKIKYEPDNELIRKTLESGIELNFARLEERGRHLTIK